MKSIGKILVAAVLCAGSVSHASLGLDVRSTEQLKQQIAGLTEAYKLRGQDEKTALETALAIVNKDRAEDKKLAVADSGTIGACVVGAGIAIVAIHVWCITDLPHIRKSLDVIVKQNAALLKIKGIETNSDGTPSGK